MKCYVCHRLHAEKRLPSMMPATMLVGGYSLCDMHCGFVQVSAEMGSVIQQERVQLYKWWLRAEAEHGNWSHGNQKFADGYTLKRAQFPWLIKKESSTIE